LTRADPAALELRIAQTREVQYNIASADDHRCSKEASAGDKQGGSSQRLPSCPSRWGCTKE